MVKYVPGPGSSPPKPPPRHLLDHPLQLQPAQHGQQRPYRPPRTLDQALQVLRNDSYRVQYAQATVELAGVRHARGDADGAHAAVEGARQLIATFADPGMLGSLLDRTERAVGRPIRRRPSAAEALTDRELVVLRLLATTLSQPEIAHELYVSVNTVRTHI